MRSLEEFLRFLVRRPGLTCIGLNVIAGDQYIADVRPSRAYCAEYAKRGLAPRMLSRTVEDTGTVTSPLVPWNSCGAYMAGVLQVPTVEYLPFAFSNLLNPDRDHLRPHRLPGRTRQTRTAQSP